MPPAVEYSEVRLRDGDDPRWSRPDWDDLEWVVAARHTPPQVPHGVGITWLRFRVRWNATEGRLPPGMHLWSLRGSYEFFWDGTLLRRSGRPGNDPSEEVAGPSQNTLGIPESMLGPGEHVVALRISSQHAGKIISSSRLYAVMKDPMLQDGDFRRINFFAVLASGALFALALVSLVLWIVVTRQRALLLLACLCFFAGTLELVTWFAIGYAYPYPWFYPLALGKAGAALAVGWLLGAIVIVEWNPPRGRWWLTGLLLVDLALAAGGNLPRVGLLPQQWIGAALVFVLVCCGWAIWRRKHGAWIAGAGVVVSLFFLVHDPLHFIGTDFFQEFLPTVLGLLFAIALRLRMERRQAQVTALAAARLEVELLKRSVQPHFLMNTLTALAQTVGENPRGAVQLINDLAEEFRSLSRMSGERHVALERELELCRAHLRVMRARTEVDWRLETEGIDPDAKVPPALFLTLIENGFSHQKLRTGAATFRIQASRTPGGVVYRFLSPGAVKTDSDCAGGGTGLRYVRARLAESFPGAWSFEHGAVPEGWETTIELRRGPNGGRDA